MNTEKFSSSAVGSPVPTVASHSQASSTQQSPRDFSIGLFDIGDTSTCLFAYLCPAWALAQSRSALDGSECCFNFMCMPPCAYRWLVRSAYGIGDPSSCAEDCLYGSFCSCCVANQLYQTTKIHGNPAPHNVGPVFNQSQFNNTYYSGDGAFMRFLGACCCQPCMMGQIMEKSVGMPFWLGCFVMNPFAGRNVMRYHYRIRPYTNGDNTEELMIPAAALCCDLALKPAIPIVDCIFKGLVAASVMQLSKEAEIRGPAQNRQYLLGYNPSQTATELDASTNGVVAVVPAMVVTNPVFGGTGTYTSGYGYGPVPVQAPKVAYGGENAL